MSAPAAPVASASLPIFSPPEPDDPDPLPAGSSGFGQLAPPPASTAGSSGATPALAPAPPPPMVPKRGLRRWLRALVRRGTSSEEDLRHQIEDLMETNGGSGQPFSAGERALIQNILDLRDLTVVDTMVPRADIVALDLEADQEETMEMIVSGAHSRYPIYHGNLDDVMGFIHVKDVFRRLANGQEVDLEGLKREILIVSPAMPVLDLLPEMRAKRVHMAMVVDEFGGIDGLVTIEDLVELIVGEIQDEHDVDQGGLKIIQADGSWVLDARYDVEDLEEEIGLVLMDEAQRQEVDTIGGLIFDLAGQVPARGALIPHPCGLEFEVLDADPRRIRRLKLRRLSEAQQRAAALAGD